MKDSTISRIIIAISIAVPLLVTLLFFISPPDFKDQIDLSFFPKLKKPHPVARVGALCFVETPRVELGSRQSTIELSTCLFPSLGFRACGRIGNPPVYKP